VIAVGCGVMCDCSGLCGVVCRQPRRSSEWVIAVGCGVMCDCSVLCGVMCDCSGLCGVVCDCSGLCGVVCRQPRRSRQSRRRRCRSR